jgi:membrane-associated phospholipid phosphatase
MARDYTGTPAVEPWIRQNIELVSSLPKDVPASSRAYSHTAVAMYDAAVASEYWKNRYKRAAPDTESVVARTPGPSYPSEHAAIAGAASRTLAALYPDYPKARLDQQAERAVDSLVAAGAIRPSDAKAGLELGRAVGAKVVEHAENDGFQEAVWDGKRPRGPEHWEPPPGSTAKPNRPWAAKSDPWIAKPIRKFRPPPPPKYGSKEFVANARDVMRVTENLTPRQKEVAEFWEGMEGTALPAGIWNQVTVEYLRDKDVSVPRQTRAFALLNVAMADAGAAAWDAKFLTGWWDPRPINAIRDLGLDKKWEPYLGTPLFPAYPSGTSNYSGAAGEVLAYTFPDDAKMWRARAVQAGMSRLWGGVHWRIDVEQGLKMGRQVGGLVVDRAKRDGAAA